MSSSSTHNILFYSSHPNDNLSRDILKELNKIPLLRDQFATFCVNSPGIKLPRVILEKNEVPVILTRGFNKPISGEAALNWIKEHNSGKAAGLDFGDVEKGSQVSEDHSILSSESGRTSYHQGWNDEYNGGTENDIRTINCSFSSIEETTDMDTLEEKGKNNTKGLKNELNRKMRQLDRQRMQDIPQQLKRVDTGGGGGLPISALNNGGRQMNFPPLQSDFGMAPNHMFPHGNIERTPNQFNPYVPVGGGGNLGRPMESMGRDFPPAPVQNPLYPPARQMDQNAGKMGFPELPPGFGNSSLGAGNSAGAGGQFSAFGDAFSGQSLLGTAMHQSQFHTRAAKGAREQSLSPGLPGGRGHGGPYQSMMSGGF